MRIFRTLSVIPLLLLFAGPVAADRAKVLAAIAAEDLPATTAVLEEMIRESRRERDSMDRRVAYLRAVETAKQLTAVEPSYENLLLQTQAQLGAGLYEQARQTAGTAVDLDPGDWRAYFYMGAAETSDFRFEEAVTSLLAARQRAAEPANLRTIWRHLGFAYEKQKLFDEAIDAYQLAEDEISVQRIQENLAMLEEIGLDGPFDGCVLRDDFLKIEELQKEAERLEKELAELEKGEG